MLIKGLQKLTLLDYPGKMACTVFTAGCNFRCPFCHNASLVTSIDDERISEEDFFSFLEKRQGIIDGVCITGGEPTLQPDLKAFLKRIKDMGYSVKLDTNGYRPEILKDIVNSGLVDYVAMDIKNSQAKYALTSGLESLDIEKINESVEFLMSGVVDSELRTTVVKELHSEDDIQDIVSWIKGAKKYYLQGFNDSGDLICTGYSGYDKNSLEKLLNIAKNHFETVELRGI
jgi:pyruvate formate lyase activating enzyme